MAKFLPGSSAGFYDSQQSDYDYAIDFLLDEGYAQSVEEADALIEQLIHEEIYLVLEHLINEGYANSENSAINIMSCMSDAWLNNIIEEFVPLTPEKYANVNRAINRMLDKVIPHAHEEVKAHKMEKLFRKLGMPKFLNPGHHRLSRLRRQAIESGLWNAKRNRPQGLDHAPLLNNALDAKRNYKAGLEARRIFQANQKKN